MNRSEAISLLLEQGWNLYGAEAIADTASEDGTLTDMTPADLITLSNDYKDR